MVAVGPLGGATSLRTRRVRDREVLAGCGAHVPAIDVAQQGYLASASTSRSQVVSETQLGGEPACRQPSLARVVIQDAGQFSRVMGFARGVDEAVAVIGGVAVVDRDAGEHQQYAGGGDRVVTGRRARESDSESVEAECTHAPPSVSNA